MAKQPVSQIGWFHAVVNRLSGDSGRYAAEYDYDTTPCIGCDDYCRCGKIVNAKVTSVSVSSLFSTLTDQRGLGKSPSKNVLLFWKYCVDRTLRAHKVWQPEHWDVGISDGYYGEEVNGGYMERHLKDAIICSINKLAVAKTMGDMLLILLKEEYGHVLPELKEKKWTIKMVDRDSIIVPQQDHYRRLDSEVVKNYTGYELPSAVVLKNDDETFRLIDGYHRLAATEGKDEVLVLVGK